MNTLQLSVFELRLRILRAGRKFGLASGRSSIESVRNWHIVAAVLASYIIALAFALLNVVYVHSQAPTQVPALLASRSILAIALGAIVACTPGRLLKGLDSPQAALILNNGVKPLRFLLSTAVIPSAVRLVGGVSVLSIESLLLGNGRDWESTLLDVSLPCVSAFLACTGFAIYLAYRSVRAGRPPRERVDWALALSAGVLIGVTFAWVSDAFRSPAGREALYSVARIVTNALDVAAPVFIAALIAVQQLWKTVQRIPPPAPPLQPIRVHGVHALTLRRAQYLHIRYRLRSRTQSLRNMSVILAGVVAAAVVLHVTRSQFAVTQPAAVGAIVGIFAMLVAVSMVSTLNPAEDSDAYQIARTVPGGLGHIWPLQLAISGGVALCATGFGVIVCGLAFDAQVSTGGVVAMLFVITAAMTVGHSLGLRVVWRSVGQPPRGTIFEFFDADQIVQLLIIVTTFPIYWAVIATHGAWIVVAVVFTSMMTIVGSQRTLPKGRGVKQWKLN